MIALVIILSCLAALSGAAIIFYKSQVSKNTCSNTKTGSPQFKRYHAYDGKYYPATVIANIITDAPYEARISNWSKYESHNIVFFTLYTKEHAADYFDVDYILKEAGITDPSAEDRQLAAEAIAKTCRKYKIYKDAIVYAVEENNWLGDLKESWP